MAERPSRLSRVLGPVVQLRDGESTTALLMFLYSFLAMTSYNIVKPITRSEFISSLGADNLPWVQFGAGVLIGFIMQGYTTVMRAVPRRWTIPVTQAGMAGLLLLFWFLFTTVGADWVAVAFYVLALILGILLISQFWTLANDVYDPRQAKRIFGFIGGGASLGGATGAGLTAFLVESLGAKQMLLVSASIMGLCFFIVTFILKREKAAGTSDATKTGEDEGVSSGEAIQLLRSSRHLQVIALVIGFAAIGAAIIEQQLNMAAAEAKGAANSDAIAAFLAQVTVYLSLIGFVIQVGLTSRIHRVMGIGFALLVLPVSLGTTAVVMLFNRALWAPGLARVLDTSLRYTVDKTSREVLFLPLPAELKYRAKPFIDVTMDRLSKGMGALMILVLIKDWGLGWNWQQLSYASLTMVGLWMFTAMRARKEYLRTFRRSIEQQDVAPADISGANLGPQSIETLVSELSHPEPRRVLYAIDLLDALDKRHLVTPLLLAHESAEIRARTLRVAEAAGTEAADRWLPRVERALRDADASVRVAAVGALAALRGQAAADVMRPFLHGSDQALAIVAAAALASSTHEADVQAAEDRLRAFSSDTREQGTAGRLLAARALGDVENPAFRPLLVPLMYDPNVEVALAAIESAGKLGAQDFLFVVPLVSLLRNRRLKSAARQVLTGFGEPVVAPLAYFMLDREENIWVRRHVPSTLAHLPFPSTVAALLTALDDPDGFLKFKAVSALERIRVTNPEIAIDKDVVTRHLHAEAGLAYSALTLHHNLFVAGGLDSQCLLARSLTEKQSRRLGRTFQLLGLINTPSDIAAVQNTLTDNDPKVRSRGIEYLDNLLSGDVRKRVMILVDDMPTEERIRKGNVIYRTRVRDVEDTVAQLLHDEDESIAAAAVLLVEERGMWSLADDLEHVLAHRDAKDQHMFEAASWALAAHRMPPDQRAALWQEPLPSVELADRLRRLPMFDFTHVNELFRLARLGRQVRHEAGRTLYQRGTRPTSVQFLLDGRVQSTGASGVTEIAAPAPLAFEAVLEGAPMTTSVTAVDRVITLALTNDEFLALLSENVELAEGLFRSLIHSRHLGADHTHIEGDVPQELKDQATAPEQLQPVDRLLLLQSSPLLAHATAVQLWRLSAIARPVTLQTGSEPIKRGGEAAILIVLSGSLTVEMPGGTTATANAGDIVGMYETLGGSKFDATMTVTETATALRLERHALFELLADHTDLLQGVFSFLLRLER
ncbi:MAG: Npt1/Npt2 family nucleotide transporter [Vicinamibacterales bacterium]|jgi:ATP/ADP translocase/HEAT repeat protein/CRP-like cAMP-binding protein